MTKGRWFACLLVGLGLVHGCGRPDNDIRPVPSPEDDRASPHEIVFRELIDELNEAADIVGGMDDEASARQARPKLTAVARRIGKTLQQIRDLKPPPKALEERLLTQLQPSLQRAGQRLSEARERAEKVPGAAAILQEVAGQFEKVGHVMKAGPPPAKR
jgi:hypothetical protein